MQELQLHDKVLLNSGEIAFINRICQPGVSYQAIIYTSGGLIADIILQKNIVKVYPLQHPGVNRYAG